MYGLHILILSCLSGAAGAQSYNASLIATITNILDNLLINYDPKIRPSHGGEPVKVKVYITVLQMGPISEKDMEWSIDCYFRQVLKDIWRPDTYIRNGRKSYLHMLTMPNVLLRVSSDGAVYVSQRLTIRARCPMFLKKFPMDTQACPLHIGSLGYNQEDLLYEWTKLFVREGIEMAQYKLTQYVYDERNVSDLREPADPHLSTLSAFFVLERQQGFYILQIYTPCTLIVVMSWVSFWLNKEASPARVSLGIMTVLTMSTLGLGGRDDLPKVSYSTALDIYIVACFGFVFSALVEYAIINFAHIVYVRKSVQQIRGFQNRNAIHEMCEFAAAIMKRREPREGGGLLEQEPTIEEEEEEEEDERPFQERLVEAVLCRNRRRTAISVGPKGRAAMYENWAARAKKKIRDSDPSAIVDKVDTISKFLFPGMYGLFNALYWSAYLYWIPDEIDSFPMFEADNALATMYS